MEIKYSRLTNRHLYVFQLKLEFNKFSIVFLLDMPEQCFNKYENKRCTEYNL